MKFNKFLRLVISLVFMLVLFQAAPVLALGVAGAGGGESFLGIDWEGLWNIVWPILAFGGIVSLGGTFGTEAMKELLRRVTKDKKLLQWANPKGGKSGILALAVAIAVQHQFSVNLFTEIELSKFIDPELVKLFTEILSAAVLWVGSMGWFETKLPAKLFKASG